MPSKSILIISSYTVSKLGRFLRHSVVNRTRRQNMCTQFYNKPIYSQNQTMLT